MEKIVLNVTYRQLFLSNVRWILYYVVLSIVICRIILRLPYSLVILAFLVVFFKFQVFNRSERKITEIAVDDNEIVLTYYKLWVKKSLHITRETFGKIKVKRSSKELCLYFYDKRFVAPPCMSVGYSQKKFNHILNNICESREDIEKVIDLFKKYNYYMEFENN